jgi:hypothetical protein
MGMPVCMLKRIMPAVEFEEWVLFHSESPIDDQSNHHLPVAQLTAYVAAANRGKNDPPKKISDFMLFTKKPEDDGVSIESLMGAGW